MWRNRFIPALDIHELVSHRRSRVVDEERMAAIIAYENSAGEMDMGAIFLRGIPRLLPVKPEQSVAIAELETSWQLLAHAAFEDQAQRYPVIDLRALFDRTPADLLAMH